MKYRHRQAKFGYRFIQRLVAILTIFSFLSHDIALAQGNTRSQCIAPSSIFEHLDHYFKTNSVNIPPAAKLEIFYAFSELSRLIYSSGQKRQEESFTLESLRQEVEKRVQSLSEYLTVTPGTIKIHSESGNKFFSLDIDIIPQGGGAVSRTILFYDQERPPLKYLEEVNKEWTAEDEQFARERGFWIIKNTVETRDAVTAEEAYIDIRYVEKMLDMDTVSVSQVDIVKTLKETGGRPLRADAAGCQIVVVLDEKTKDAALFHIPAGPNIPRILNEKRQYFNEDSKIILINAWRDDDISNARKAEILKHVRTVFKIKDSQIIDPSADPIYKEEKRLYSARVVVLNPQTVYAVFTDIKITKLNPLFVLEYKNGNARILKVRENNKGNGPVSADAGAVPAATELSAPLSAKEPQQDGFIQSSGGKAPEELKKIRDIFKSGNLNECYLAIDILLRMNVRKDDFDYLFGILSDSPYKKQILAGYCLANITLKGAKEEAVERYGRHRKNPIASLLEPKSRYIYFYLLRLHEARNRGGVMNHGVNRRIINLTIALDNHGLFSGEKGRSWFTQLRHSVHTNTNSYDLKTVRKLLYHWKDKNIEQIEGEYKTLIQCIPDYFSGEELDICSSVLNKALKLLHSDGHIKSLEADNFLDEFNSIDLETVIDAVHREGDKIIADKVSELNEDWEIRYKTEDYQRVIEKIENTIRLFYALTERYGVLQASVVPKILGDVGDDILREREHNKKEMHERTEFMRADYDNLVKVIDSTDSQAVLKAVAQCRVRIRDHLLYDKIEPTEWRDEDELKNEFLELDFNLYLFGKEKVISLLGEIEKCETMDDLKKHIDSLASIGKFLVALGLGGVEFEQFITELDTDTLTFSQLHDLVRSARIEIHKITRGINESIRSATEYIWEGVDYYDLTDEWRKQAYPLTKLVKDRWENDQIALTKEAQDSVVDNMVDTLIRDTQILSFDQILMKFNDILETQLTQVNDAMAVERYPSSLPSPLRGEGVREEVPLPIGERLGEGGSLSDHFFRFGQPEVIPRDKLLSLWSKKGLNLVKMTEGNIPVPPGVIVSSRLVTRPDIFRSASFKEEVQKEIGLIQKYSKYPDLKLLLYARSGSAFTLPGLLTTIPNLGMNDEEAEDLAKTTGDMWFAYDTYAEFIRSYAINILGIPEEYFQDILNVYEKDKLSGEEMKEVVERYKKLVVEKCRIDMPSPRRMRGEGGDEGQEDFYDIIPKNMIDQVMRAIDSVYASWDSEDARAYRERHKISQEWGTVVILQKGVFGNLSKTEDGRISGTGFGALRVLPDGREAIQGKFRFRAHGDQLMSRADQNYVLLSNSQRIGNEQTLEDLQSDIYQQILKRAHELKEIFGNNQQIELVVELNNLWITQSNDDFVTDDYPEFADTEGYEVTGRGHGVSAGAFRGWAANSLKEAEVLVEKYNREKPKDIDGVILFVDRVNPEFINRIPKGVAICAKVISVHAETLAQKNSIPSVYGISGMGYIESENCWYINGKKMEDGMVISIDGHENQLVYHNSGRIFEGSIPLADKRNGNAEVERRTPRASAMIAELRDEELRAETMAKATISFTRFEKEILALFVKYTNKEMPKGDIDRYKHNYGIILDKIAFYSKGLDFKLYGDEFKAVLSAKLAELGIDFDLCMALYKTFHPTTQESKDTLNLIIEGLNYTPPAESQEVEVYDIDGNIVLLNERDTFGDIVPVKGDVVIMHPLKKPVKLVSFDLDGAVEQFMRDGKFSEIIELFQRLKAEDIKIAITSTNPGLRSWFKSICESYPLVKTLVDFCEQDSWHIDLERYSERLGIGKDEIIHFGNEWVGSGVSESVDAEYLHDQGFVSIIVKDRFLRVNIIMEKKVDAVMGRISAGNVLAIINSYKWQKDASGALNIPDSRGMSGFPDLLGISPYRDTIRDAINSGGFKAVKYNDGVFSHCQVIHEIMQATVGQEINEEKLRFINNSDISEDDKKLLSNVTIFFIDGLDEKIKEKAHALGLNAPEDCRGAHYGVSRMHIYLDSNVLENESEFLRQLHHEIKEQSGVIRALDSVFGRYWKKYRSEYINAFIGRRAEEIHRQLLIEEGRYSLIKTFGEREARQDVIRHLSSENANDEQSCEPIEWEQMTENSGRIHFCWRHIDVPKVAHLSTGFTKIGKVKVKRFYDKNLKEWIYKTERDVEGQKVIEYSRVEWNDKFKHWVFDSKAYKAEVVKQLKSEDVQSKVDFSSIEWEQCATVHGTVEFHLEGTKHAYLATGIKEEGLIKIRRFFDEEIGEWIYETIREKEGKKVICTSRLVKKGDYWSFEVFNPYIDKYRLEVLRQLYLKDAQSISNFYNIEWEQEVDVSGCVRFSKTIKGKKKVMSLSTGCKGAGMVKISRFYDSNLKEWIYRTERELNGLKYIEYARLEWDGINEYWVFRVNGYKKEVIRQLSSKDAQSKDAFTPLEWEEIVGEGGQIRFSLSEESVCLSTGRMCSGLVKVKRFYDENLKEWIYRTEREVDGQKYIEYARLNKDNGDTNWSFEPKAYKKEVIRQLTSDNAKEKNAFMPLGWEQTTGQNGYFSFSWLGKEGEVNTVSLWSGLNKYGEVFKIKRFYDEVLQEWIYEAKATIDGRDILQRSRLIRHDNHWVFLPMDHFDSHSDEWRWIWGSFKSKAMRRYILSGKISKKIKILREAYATYIRMLKISPEEESILQEDIVLATFYCALYRAQVGDAIELYLKKLKKLELNTEIKKMIIRATYMITMHGNMDIFRKSVDDYCHFVGEIKNVKRFILDTCYRTVRLYKYRNDDLQSWVTIDMLPSEIQWLAVDGKGTVIDFSARSNVIYQYLNKFSGDIFLKIGAGNKLVIKRYDSEGIPESETYDFSDLGDVTGCKIKVVMKKGKVKLFEVYLKGRTIRKVIKKSPIKDWNSVRAVIGEKIDSIRVSHRRVSIELMREEEIALIKLYQEQHNDAALDVLIRFNLKLVERAVQKFRPRLEVDREDMVSEGLKALFELIDSFEIEKCSDFKKTARILIRNRIIDYLRRETHDKQLKSREVIQGLKVIAEAERKYLLQYGRYPQNYEDIAKFDPAFGMSRERYYELIRRREEMVDYIEDAGGSQIRDKNNDSGGIRHVLTKQFLSKLDEAFPEFYERIQADDKERVVQILGLRLGYDFRTKIQTDPLGLKEITERIGSVVTESRICQIVKKHLLILQEILTDMGIDADFFDEDVDMSGALKEVGWPLSDEIIKEAEGKETEWREKAKLVGAREYTKFKIKAKVIKVDNLPEGIAAWNFKDGDGNLVIIIPSFLSSPQQVGGEGVRSTVEGGFLDELIYHEFRENYWMSQGLARRDAHILASYEQAVEFAEAGKLTPYHQNQIDEMAVSDLQFLVDEYKKGRKYNYGLIKKKLGKKQLDIAKQYEALFINEVLLKHEGALSVRNNPNYKGLEDLIMQIGLFASEISKLGGQAQRTNNIRRLQFAVPVDVSKNAGDFSLALKKMGSLARGNAVFEIIIYDLDKEVDGDKFIKELNLPANIKVYSVTKEEIGDSSDIVLLRNVIQRKYPIKTGEHLMIATNMMNAESAEKLKDKIGPNLGDNVSVGAVIAPNEESVVSLSKILTDLLDNIGKSKFSVILPIVLSAKDIKQRLEEELSALWQALQSA